jgi:TolA-binding protein
MYGLVLGVAMVAALGMAGSRAASDTIDPRVPRGWLQDDPADSLYRRARETLNRRDYRAAADLFAQIPVRFPRSGYAADALYWQAFALYRAGGERDLREAMVALRKQREQFPKAATQGDAATLERRIQGELARRGDSEAAAQVAEAASNAGYVSAAMTT